jgi:molybdenum cofactor cytidylyltransferase
MPQEVTVIVLAAGNSARFRAAGGEQGKLQSPFTTKRGTYTVLEHVLRAVKASGLAWHVVEAVHTQHLPIQGMGSSIATGVAATKNAKGWLILPADLPLIQPDTLRVLAAALEHHEVVAPIVQGERGHPVGFSKICQPDLLTLQGDLGAKRITQQYDLHLIPLEDAGCILDVDTPKALALAQQFAFAQKI